MAIQHRPFARIANKYSPGSGNKYDMEDNPYSQKSNTQPVNSAPTVPKKSPSKNETDSDDLIQKSDYQSKNGYLHAIAGLSPVSDDDYYRVGYDEGIAVLAEHYQSSGAVLDWKPVGTVGVIVARHIAGSIWVAPQDGRWVWWSDGEIAARGGGDSVLAAVNAAEKHLMRAVGSVNIPLLVDEAFRNNPDVDAQSVVRVAKIAANKAISAMKSGGL